MGKNFSAPWRTAHTSIILVGLDNAGKTTILKKLKEMNHHKTHDEEIVPTIGMSRDYVQLREHGLRLTTLDLSGSGRYRGMWEDALTQVVSGIVFVVDASDDLRFVVAREEMEMLLKSEACSARKTPLPILVLANKMDLPGAATPLVCSRVMGLHEGFVHGSPWHICATNGLTGEGLEDGIGWLAGQLWQVIKSKK